MDHSYAADVCMEPLFWFVTNFTKIMGPVKNFFLNILYKIIFQFLVVRHCCRCFNQFRSWNCVLDRSSILVESKPIRLHYSSHNRPLAFN